MNVDSVAYCDQCFGCGMKNPCGLKLKFDWDGKVVRSEFTTAEIHQGWREIIHGGILTALCDEAMAYAAFYDDVPGVTASIEVRFRKPVNVGQHLNITAWVSQKARRYAETRASLALDDGTVVTEAKAMQFVSREVTVLGDSGEEVTKHAGE